MATRYGDLIDLFKKMQSGGMKLDENTMKSFIEFRKTNPNDFKELSNRVMRGYKLYGMNSADTPGAEDTNLQAVSSGNVMNAPGTLGEQGMPRNGATPAEAARLAVHTQNVDDATGMQGMKRISILPARAEQAAARSLYSGQGMPTIKTAQSANASQYVWQAKNGQGASGQAAYGSRDESIPSEVNETDDQKKDQIAEYMQKLVDQYEALMNAVNTEDLTNIDDVKRIAPDLYALNCYINGKPYPDGAGNGIPSPWQGENIKELLDYDTLKKMRYDEATGFQTLFDSIVKQNKPDRTIDIYGTQAPGWIPQWYIDLSKTMRDTNAIPLNYTAGTLTTLIKNGWKALNDLGNGRTPSWQGNFTWRGWENDPDMLNMIMQEWQTRLDKGHTLGLGSLGQEQQIKDAIAKSPFAKFLLSAVFETAVDPTTYIGPGAIAKLKGIAKLNKVEEAEKALKSFEEAEKALNGREAALGRLVEGEEIPAGIDKQNLGNYYDVKGEGNVLQNANFAQRTYKSSFSLVGQNTYSDIAGVPIKTVDDLASALIKGLVKPSDVPIDYIIRDGNVLILNTRSSHALMQAGIPRSQWNAVNRTDIDIYESMLTNQLKNNGLASSGTPTARMTGGQ